MGQKKYNSDNTSHTNGIVSAVGKTVGEVVKFGSDFAAAKYVKHKHDAAKPVMIGGYPVWLGANWDIPQEVLAEVDYILPLNGTMPEGLVFFQWASILFCELEDRGGVPSSWKTFIEYVVGLIKEGKKVLAYCTGGHGRTGTFGASLIALMEPETEDPIKAIRERHCEKAVESRKQAKAVYELRGATLPKEYKQEFKEYTYSNTGGFAGGTAYSPALEDQFDWGKQGDVEVQRLLEAAFKDGTLEGWGGPTMAAQGKIKVYPVYKEANQDRTIPRTAEAVKETIAAIAEMKRAKKSVSIETSTDDGGDWSMIY